MRALCIGDVVADVGCNYLMKTLPKFKRDNKIDFVIVNGENSASGNGLTKSSAMKIFDCGADVITSGNHAFRRSESYDYYESCNELIRPANFPPGAPGRGYTVIDMLRYKICVINLMGTLFMESLDCPFRTADKILDMVSDCSVKIVDFHAEATSEKKAMGYYLDGRVSAVFGTHTHVQTSDECILVGGTGYITDVGMTGPDESVLGVKKELVIAMLKNKMPIKFETAEGECRMNCVVFDINEKTGKTIDVKRYII